MNEGNAEAALAHMERLLGETYRREIEREENIWRSLPFFVATLALELTALFQVADRLPSFDTRAGWLAIACLGASGASTLTALIFLAASIYPARFDYLPDDVELLGYLNLILNDDELGASKVDALIAVQSGLAEQYAAATDHNRRINKRRERRRSVAGLATLGAMLATLLLVATTFLHYMPERTAQGSVYGPAQPNPVRPTRGETGDAGRNAPSHAPDAPNAGGH